MGTSSSRPYFPQLDGIRAFAIVLVLVGHRALHGGFGVWSVAVQQLAKLGVLFFFVLSGFLITTLMCAEEGRTGRIDLRSFYARRALRIFPAMVLFVTVSCVLAALHLIDDLGWVDVAAALLYVRNVFGHSHAFAHLWSLSIEEQFYLAWPVTMVLARGRTRARLGVALAGVVAISAWRGVAIALHLFDRNIGIYYQRTDFRFDSILAGCALALVLRDESPRVVAAATAVLRRVPAAFVALLVVYIAITFDVTPSPLGLTAETLLVTLFVGRIALGGGPTVAALKWPPLRWIGRISYSWYLWQEIFLVVRTPSWGVARTFPFDVIASLAVAAASYYLVERPFLRLKGAIEQAGGEQRAPRASESAARV
jgi:peptidoglycan/LPS O-acetylase OafA/YrhL